VDTLFSYFKTQYDYIIVDTAPVSLVADTLLIAKCGCLLYVARANFFEKRMLNINNLYKEQNYQTCVCFLMIQTRLKDMVTAMVMVMIKP
jgi:hypothetical protein